MITPAQIKKRAESMYHQFMKGWLLGEPDEFPRRVTATIQLSPTDVVGNQRSIELLRAKSKATLGWGYRLEEGYVASRTMGHGVRPREVWIDTRDDLLRLAEKQKEFERISKSVVRLRSELPRLKDWVLINWKQLPRLYDDLDGLISVANYFTKHPFPSCYSQQLPIEVDTKFIKKNEATLWGWLDALLPPSQLIAHEKSSFARRFGLREAQVQRRMLLLDTELCVELGLPFDDFAAQVESLKNLSVRNAVVVIVENPRSLESVPRLPRSLVVEGRGFSVLEAKAMPWLMANRVIYWGDIDPAGFQILAALRGYIPHLESILMDRRSYDRHSLFAKPVKQPKAELVHLTDEEQSIYQHCQHHQAKVEQEKLSQKWVCDEFAAMVSDSKISSNLAFHETSHHATG